MSMMQSVILGIMQGISEFIPISSSGHLVVLRAVMGIEEIPLLYDVVLHIATLIVVVWFFRKRICTILGSLLRWARRRPLAEDAYNLQLAGVIIVATVMTAVLGFAIGELNLHTMPHLVPWMFLITAALLVAAHFVGSRPAESPITARHGVIVGIVQGLAVIPGISRSGSTIFASLASGVPREKAGEFSFLISVPAILGATILEMRDLSGLTAVVSPAAMAVGFLASLVVGYLSLALLVRLIRGGKLWVFSLYLVPLGIWGLFAL
ncbi:undecaprenyl-diphosphate phosphatase [Spirochaeta africana]|uniref:Undecaprenyl-diphosphatase n=1 Tax=Spirochaeta africana (strain ATCC 700263 / DSM 8902 / Z-7692) TaxID=889378 RepID=H9UGQ4_SPIAZ|nr:undecaprenyl-diphosphate phosphatase [Spirochaeta africana]AFG36697.1 putative bacitracin resistance protein [Spirochaeta africana DSM 8902]